MSGAIRELSHGGVYIQKLGFLVTGTHSHTQAAAVAAVLPPSLSGNRSPSLDLGLAARFLTDGGATSSPAAAQPPRLQGPSLRVRASPYPHAMSSDEVPPRALPTVESPSVQNSSSADLSQSKIKGKTDPAWGYCVQVIDGGKQKIRCCFCSALVGGAGKDSRLRAALTSEMRIFRQAEGDFGRATAINDRANMLPDEWWLTYGCSAPHLQKLAVRVLSQTCSASGCERNWSLFEHIHSKKRNRLEHQRMNDMVYCHYNQRLQQRSKLHARNYDPISLEDIGKFNEEWILEEDPAALTAEEVDTFRNVLTSVVPDCRDRDEVLLVDDADIDEVDEAEEAAPHAESVPNDDLNFIGVDVNTTTGGANDRWPSMVDWNMDHI